MTWIPIYQNDQIVRMPELPGCYLVTIRGNGYMLTREASFGGKRWYIFNQNDNEMVKSGKARIVAFMPMPEPMNVNKFVHFEKVRLLNGYTGIVLDVPGDERPVDGSGVLMHYRVVIETPNGALSAFFPEYELAKIEG